MLRAYVIDFSGHWDQFLPLEEFACNNSYHSSIEMAPFKALYGRSCRSPIGWFDAFEVKPWGAYLLRDTLDKMKLMEFMVGESVLLKVSPLKSVMRFGKRWKLNLRFIGPFEIVQRIGKILKKYHLDSSHMIRWDSVLLDHNLAFEEELIVILDRQVQKLRLKEIALVKVQWRHRPVEKANGETNSDMRSTYL
ncbi:uncharacterized protein LOC132048916 [Lycium ferocissimum]|uniref:uncharacterized protein LOC132048916 n=1 Tax=Lycium ferocissimum TaxID=112874 RepID=UPI00281564CD|nr:uncharacterized protein LOC132048916 [Lycium ferocissimum]